MTDEQSHAVSNQLRRLIGRQSGCTLSDAQLLEDFLNERDEAAFEVLVWRHGTMVLSLCKRILHDEHEAEDAFQVTFLVLARKASSIGKRESLGSWLYKVAYRVALRVRAETLKHAARQEPLDDVPARDSGEELLWRNLRPVLDEEIDRLPEKYRIPFVLCYLEGHTNEEAAEQLGCPKGTILSRLARGRERLRNRLARRGIGLSLAGLTALLSQNAASAAPAVLVSSTVSAAIPFAAGQALTGLVSSSVAALTEGALRTLFLVQVKVVAAALLALALLGTGAGLFLQRSPHEKPRTPLAQADGVAPVVALREAETPGASSSPNSEESSSDRRSRDDVRSATAGKVVSASRDGKSFTLEVPAQGRGEEPKTLAIQIGERTTVTYSGVGLDGARPMAGYSAQVRLREGTKDLADNVLFQGPAGRGRQPDVVGKIVGVARDGKGMTLEVASRRGREADARKADLRLDDRTVLVFSSVAAGGARLREGYTAQVWLDEGGVAGSVQLTGLEPAERRERGEGRPDLAGRIVAVARDGRAITLQVHVPRSRTEEPSQFEIQVADRATVVYHQVGVDGARLAVGLQAQVWLEDGSRETARKVKLTGTPREKWPLLVGKVVGVSADGTVVTLEQPAVIRGEPPRKTAIKLTAKTWLSFSGVGPGEARPTEGQTAQVRLEERSNEAVEASFRPAGQRER